MSLRELLIELKVKAETAAVDRLNASLDGTTARVATLDAGLLAVGGAAADAARLSGAAMRELGSIAGATATEMAGALRDVAAPMVARIQQLAEVFRPLIERARAATAAIGAHFAEAQTAFRVLFAEPIRRYADFAFEALDSRVRATMGRVTARFTELRAAVNELLVPPVRRAATVIQTALGGAFAQVQARATVMGQRVSAALQPITIAAARVRATLAPILTPLITAAARTRGVMAQWGTGIAAIGERMGAALRASISESTARSVATVQSWLQRVSSMAQQAIAKVRAAGQQKAPSAPAAGGGGGMGAGMLAGAVGGAVVGAAMAGVAALKQYATTALETAGAVADLRDSTGLSAKEIQTWIPILGESGASAGDFKTGLKSLSKEVASAAAGNKAAQQSLAALGLDYQKLAQQPLEQNFNEVARALANTENGAKRLDLANKVLGDRAGTNLVAAFANGGAALDAQRDKFGSMSMMTDETITKLDGLGDKMAETKLKLGVAGAQIMAAFEPLITTLLPLIEPIVQAITPIVQVLATALKPAVEALVPLMTDAIAQFKPIWDALGPVIADLAGEFVSALVPAIKSMLPIMLQLLRAVMPLVPVLGEALISALVALMPAIVQVAQALVPLVQQLVPVLIPMIQTLSAIVAGLGQAFSTYLAAVLPMISSYIEILINNVNVAYRALKFLWALITGGPSEVSKAEEELGAALDAWLGAFMEFGDNIAQFFSKLWSKLTEGALTFINGAKSLLGFGEGGAGFEISHAIERAGGPANAAATLTTGMGGGAAMLPAGSVGGKVDARNQSYENNSTTNISISASSPIDAGRQVQSYVDRMSERDASGLMSTFGGATG